MTAVAVVATLFFNLFFFFFFGFSLSKNNCYLFFSFCIHLRISTTQPERADFCHHSFVFRRQYISKFSHSSLFCSFGNFFFASSVGWKTKDKVKTTSIKRLLYAICVMLSPFANITYEAYTKYSTQPNEWMNEKKNLVDKPRNAKSMEIIQTYRKSECLRQH